MLMIKVADIRPRTWYVAQDESGSLTALYYSPGLNMLALEREVEGESGEIHSVGQWVYDLDGHYYGIEVVGEL